MLARSFADIGDIVRGKDLYLGGRGRDQLESKLKEIFAKIHDDVTSTSGKNGKALKARYQKDGPDYYQLREDWWNNNRKMVWYAITCGAAGSQYFRGTCGSGKTPTQGDCRCKTNVVPTYFDYVPQFLRWFEEWAEDFCRKRKKQLTDAIQKCRGEYQGDPRYCSRNGFDCERTIYKKGYFVIDKGCINCLYACNPYVEWIDNQRKQFDKQKKKYDEEMQKYTNGGGGGGNRRLRRGATTTNYDGYESKFYEQLKKNKYGKVDEFLEKLSKGKICEDHPEVKKKTHVNFNENLDDIFSHTEYCQPCPPCGVERKGDEWKEKNDGQCKGGNLYTISTSAESTDINVLSFGDKGDEIKSKIDKFCNQTSGSSVVAGGSGDCGGTNNSDSSLCEPWKCYKEDDIEKRGVDDEVYNKEVKGAGGLCILENKKHKRGNNSSNEPKEIQKTYNDFFYYWVAHMLKDSIHWKKKLEKCLQNGNKKCGNQKCEKPCDCFKRWVEKKQQEWEDIKKHFKKQNIGAETGCNPIVTLEGVLKLQFLNENTEEHKKNNVSAEEAKEIKQLSKIIEKKNQEEAASGVVVVPTCGEGADNEKETLMDKLIDYERGEATKCKNCEQPQQPAGGRSETNGPQSPPADDPNHDDEDDPVDDPNKIRSIKFEDEKGKEPDFNDPEEEDDEDEDDDVEEASEEVEGPKVEVETVKPCQIVATLFSNVDNLTQACTLKYGYPQRHWGWKCVTSGEKTTGSICVPPRRRKLYVGKLEQWAKTVVEPRPGETTQVSTSAGTSSPSNSRDVDLRNAFVESAAVETFFLWDRYKKEWLAQKKAEQARQNGELLFLNGGSPQPPGSGSDDNNPQKKLQESGEIPPDFLRLMFYTLGDYRDILYSGDKENGSKYMLVEDIKNISEKIKSILNNENDAKTTAQQWWDKNAKHIWKGMICALTYEESGAIGGKPTEDPTVKEAFFGTQNGKPGPQNGTAATPTGTYEKTYKYDKVELKEQNGTEAKPIIASASSDTPTINNPKLTEFVVRPPYFRYLEEWGETFCRQRTRMLKDVKDNCRNSDNPGHHYCSGDGHDCTDKNHRHRNMFANLDCRPCYEQCRKYRKWIDMKFVEYHKQEKKYKDEYGKLTERNCSGSGDDNNCCEQIKKHSTAADFLKSLKHCKPGDDDGDTDNKLDFEEPLKTFGPLEYCKTCPPNKVNCRTRGRTDTKPCTPDNGNKWQSVFDKIRKNNENSTTINVEMVDRRGINIDKKFEQLFKESYLFKSVREQNWECKVINNDTDVCHLTNFNDKIDLNDYTTFKVFLEYWLEDFLYGYYLLKKKIDLCTQKEGKTCEEDSKNDCACVKKWVEQKSTQWGKIQEHFQKQKNANGDDIKSKVKFFFQQEPFESDLKKAKGNFESLEELETSLKCNDTDSSQKDIIECILKDLQKKIDDCKSQPGQKQQPCVDNPSPSGENSILDDENLDQTTIEIPGVCNTVEEPEETTKDKKEPKKEQVPEPSPKKKDTITCKTNKFKSTEPKIPMNCVEKIAKELQENFENDMDCILKQNITPIDCTNESKQSSPGNISCDLKIPLLCNNYAYTRNPCDNKGKNQFNVDREWKCYKIFRRHRENKGVCVPPRREIMCTKALEYMRTSNYSNTEKLLNIVLLTAAYEGKNLKEQWEKIKDRKIKRYELCDAMKYSFADLGDIIRGRDKYTDIRYTGRNSKKIEENLKKVFENIQKTNTYFQKEYPNLKTFRSAWWDANREYVWKAMTCSAPENFYFVKRGKGDGSDFEVLTFSEHIKCGHKEPPPVDDYIPQRLRWMTEWSEYFCKAMNKNIDEMKVECDKCTSGKCSNDTEGKFCIRCKEKCKSYSEFINKWKEQLETQSKSYKKLYEMSETYSSFSEDVKLFVKKLKENQKDCSVKNAFEYIHKTSNCVNYKFNENDGSSNIRSYAFEETPKSYKEACSCTLHSKNPLDNCPTDQNKDGCKELQTCTFCSKNDYDNNLDNWNAYLVLNSSDDNKGVLIPPRRRHLCTRPITAYNYRKGDKEILKKKLLTSAFSQGILLGKKFKEYSDKSLQSMKYSFADYADIIKGTDMMDNYSLNQLKNKLNELLKENNDNEILKHRENWWDKNKTHVWHAMLCGYHKGVNEPPQFGRSKKSQTVSLPEHSPTATANIPSNWCTVPTEDKTDQFLRWFKEWSEHFCTRRNEFYVKLETKCSKAKCEDGRIYPNECKILCEEYRNFIAQKKIQYDVQMYHYNKKYKNSQLNNKKGPDFFDNKCNGKCSCLSNHIDDKDNWKYVYDTYDNKNLKGICDCQKPEPPPPPLPPPPAVDPPQADEPFDPTILQTTIPFGIALALGSIAFLFLKVKENIYMWYIYVRSVWVCMCLDICICFIYIYVFIMEKEKKEKRKRNIGT
ncbi:PfEMP1 [Plasmodium falciparum Dd2]|uniref:PfEMP1 n=1 Tax=Plasmodium falciparum (isolate Dd2) TaxID=57267 RepID=A0A0L7LW95_PLAF4|nr:PfEMP1 [Plasmodium falciparum Dd2]